MVSIPDQSSPHGKVLVAPNNPGTWIGKLWRKAICAHLTMLLNPRIVVMSKDSNGISSSKDATIVMGPNGWTATLPAVSIPAVTPPTPYVNTVPFSGYSDPPGGLPAGNYVAGPTPSLFVNMNAKTLWACIVSGSPGVWAQISGASNTGFAVYSLAVAYAQGSGVYVAGLGTFWAKVDTAAGIAPAWPENTNWKLIAFDVLQDYVCRNGTSSQINFNGLTTT